MRTSVKGKASRGWSGVRRVLLLAGVIQTIALHSISMGQKPTGPLYNGEASSWVLKDYIGYLDNVDPEIWIEDMPSLMTLAERKLPPMHYGLLSLHMIRKARNEGLPEEARSTFAEASFMVWKYQRLEGGPLQGLPCPVKDPGDWGQPWHTRVNPEFSLEVVETKIPVAVTIAGPITVHDVNTYLEYQEIGLVSQEPVEGGPWETLCSIARRLAWQRIAPAEARRRGWDETPEWKAWWDWQKTASLYRVGMDTLNRKAGGTPEGKPADGLQELKARYPVLIQRTILPGCTAETVIVGAGRHQITLGRYQDWLPYLPAVPLIEGGTPTISQNRFEYLLGICRILSYLDEEGQGKSPDTLAKLQFHQGEATARRVLNRLSLLRHKEEGTDITTLAATAADDSASSTEPILETYLEKYGYRIVLEPDQVHWSTEGQRITLLSP